MDNTDLANGTTLKAQIDKINAVQAATALSGAKGFGIVVNSTGETIVSKDDIIAAIGGTAYNTLCSNFLTALNTALGSAETTATTAFAAL